MRISARLLSEPSLSIVNTVAKCIERRHEERGPDDRRDAHGVTAPDTVVVDVPCILGPKKGRESIMHNGIGSTRTTWRSIAPRKRALTWPIWLGCMMGALAVFSPLASSAADEIHYTITGQTSVTFDWRSSAAENMIRYGLTSGNYTTTLTATTPSPLPFSSAGPFREARLTGLQEGTTYYYQIGNEPEATFKTPPPLGAPDFTVSLEADIGASTIYPNMAIVQALIASSNPNFVLVAGDLTYGDEEGQGVVDQHFNDVMVWSRTIPYMPAWGNHEWQYSGDDLRNYKGRFDLVNPKTSPGVASINCCSEDWYWFDYGNTRFIAYPEPTSGAWADWNTRVAAIMSAAQSDSRLKFIVTVGHRPAYSSGHHPGDSTLKNILNALGDTYSKYLLNINGHSHNYERSFPQHRVTHLTVGTGGSDLEQDGSCLWLTCTKPAWSAQRFMQQGLTNLTFGSTSIAGEFICGPKGGTWGGTNDVTCSVGEVIDRFVIDAVIVDTIPPATPTGLSVSQ
jgi:hypothetical protein